MPLFLTGPERTKVFAQQPRLCRLSAEIGATVWHSPCAPLAAVPALPESPVEPASRETPERWLLLVWRPPLQREAASLKGLSASLPAAPRFRNQLLGKLLQCCGDTSRHSPRTPMLSWRHNSTGRRAGAAMPPLAQNASPGTC